MTSTNGHPHRARDQEEVEEAIDAPFDVPFVHRIRFTTDVFSPANGVLREVVAESKSAQPARMIAFIDEGVASTWPGLAQSISDWADAHSDRITLAAPPATVTGGERAKNGWSVFETGASAIHDARICRHSFVFAIGGGAMLDAVGFAAATAHRGVRLVRMPTTTLAQSDAAIGVKNGINAFGKKNFLGCFAPPWAVINDTNFLTTLTNRDWRAGLSEVVKVSLLKDRGLFDQIEAFAAALARRDHAAALPLLRRSAELHLNHITQGGDPFELSAARPLDFGHWSAHKLEQMTEFEVRHGEAVAIGIALDSVYSALCGTMSDEETERILSCLSELGFALYHDELSDHDAMIGGLDEFREHLGGRLTITLLEGIGKPFEVHEIDRSRMLAAVRLLGERALQRAAGQ